ncbi:hypothetical protein LB462_23925 [Phyllobacterium sp. KW56]|nr:hypothetical protein [Phyllobacterium sp. KW56]
MVVAHGPAYAGFYDGNKLYEECSRKVETAKVFCMGYITGVADTLEDTQCFTKGIDARQVHDVVKQYLESHPEERHHRASSIVASAVQKAFCKR